MQRWVHSANGAEWAKCFTPLCVSKWDENLWRQHSGTFSGENIYHGKMQFAGDDLHPARWTILATGKISWSGGKEVGMETDRFDWFSFNKRSRKLNTLFVTRCTILSQAGWNSFSFRLFPFWFFPSLFILLGNVLWIMAWGGLGLSVFLSELHHCYHFAIVCLDVGSTTVSLLGQMVELLLSSSSFASWSLKWEISLIHLHWFDLCSWFSFPARDMVVAPSQVPGVWHVMTPSPARLHVSMLVLCHFH